MKTGKRRVFEMVSLLKSVSRLGTRTIMACVTGLIAACLIFAAPEVGIAGAIGGVVMGGISAILVHPHA
jgi:membrane associated rhomboid family serine protease